jgi:predicted kinase
VAARDLPDGPNSVDTPNHENSKDAVLRGRQEALGPAHPSAPGYLDSAGRHAERGDSPDAAKPLSDAGYAARVCEIDATLADWRKTYRGTEYQHTTDSSHQVWSAERAARHDEIIQHMYAKAANVPCDGKAILAGGLPGAGKTTVLTALAGVDRSQYLVINPDAIKEQMASRDMQPDIPGLSPMEATELAHEESSYISKQLALRAYADGKNVIWDITMSSTDSTQRRVGELRAAGYTDIEAIFIDIPVEVSLSRAEARHRKEHDAYRAGDGLGGRYIPPDLIRAQADPDHGSTNRATFERVKQHVDRWRVFDNSVDGREAALVAPEDHRGRETAA